MWWKRETLVDSNGIYSLSLSDQSQMAEESGKIKVVDYGYVY